MWRALRWQRVLAAPIQPIGIRGELALLALLLEVWGLQQPTRMLWTFPRLHNIKLKTNMAASNQCTSKVGIQFHSRRRWDRRTMVGMTSKSNRWPGWDRLCRRIILHSSNMTWFFLNELLISSWVPSPSLRLKLRKMKFRTSYKRSWLRKSSVSFAITSLTCRSNAKSATKYSVCSVRSKTKGHPSSSKWWLILPLAALLIHSSWVTHLITTARFKRCKVLADKEPLHQRRPACVQAATPGAISSLK